MFCTGGIRCEKSTAFLRHEGVEEVVHLKGGILAYLEQVPEADSRWHGSCFVFDERVSVGHGLVEVGEKDCAFSRAGAPRHIRSSRPTAGFTANRQTGRA